MSGGFLIAYDITDSRRLARMHRFLSGVAVPIEYSVFFHAGDVRAVLAVLTEAALRIDPGHDDLRCYPLPQRGTRVRLGRASLPAGIHYSALPAEWRSDN